MSAASMQIFLQCSECDATLTAPTTKVRDAIRWAEDNHRWVTIGQGIGQAIVCPQHTIPCGRCGHRNTTDEEIAARRQIREETRQRMAQRKSFRRPR